MKLGWGMLGHMDKMGVLEKIDGGRYNNAIFIDNDQLHCMKFSDY